MENLKRIAVLNLYQFPKGMAPTTRIISYTKGLYKNGVDCDIISIRPKDDFSGPLVGKCEGGTYFHFCYAPQGRFWNSCRILHAIACRIKNRLCDIKAIHLLLKNRKNYDWCILSVDALEQLALFAPILHCAGIKISTIADEYPCPIRNKMKSEVPPLKLRCYRLVNHFVDARILMTKYLQDFYNRKVCVKPSLIVSTIVDVERFLDVKDTNNTTEEYLCYMGNMSLAKDNVDNIIKAFARVTRSYPKLKLFLYGTPNSCDRQVLESLIDELGIGESVVIKGRADYAMVPQILKDAKILVTSQPVTKRAEGGFPTKLGEYFMTGKPTILTDVGEIHNYVSDGVNCFLVEPENPEKYAETIRTILDNYSDSLIVAQRAKQLILDEYSAEKAGRDIINFFEC